MFVARRGRPMNQALPAAMGLTKGIRFTSPQAFVVERSGAEAWEALVASLPAPDRAALREVVPAGWYDHALRARLVRRLSGRFGAAAAFELGRHEAERDLTTVHRWFLRLVKPAFAIRNMNLYWCRSEAGGRWTSEVDGQAIVARLYDWDPVEPALCRTLEGYLGRTLELLGDGKVAVEHVRCRAEGAPFCEFRTEGFSSSSSSVGARARMGNTAVLPGDLPGIAYELAQLSDLDAVAEAVVGVLSRRLSFSHVALRVRMEPGGEPRLLMSAGSPGAGVPGCFVLQAGGGTVGRLDVEAPPGQAHAEVLDELLPCFAIALRGAGACTESPPAPDGGSRSASAEQRARRIDEAARRWAATPRQREVLERVVQGMTNKEIAAEVGCQEGTVEVHVSQLLKKSRAGNRAGLAAKVWAEG
jgi:DNA-binding CsgD family transcriptional regulator